MKRRKKNRAGRADLSGSRPVRVFLHLLRLLTGAVFVFSGFVKAVDPLGTVYKIEDYLHAFDGMWIHLSVLAFPAALVLIALELMVGIQLLLMLRFRTNAAIAFVFMLIMTPLTLYIAVSNPVTDCGCFGDALKISNWHTFLKNIVLLVITFVLFMFRNKFKSFFLPPVEYGLAILFFIFSGAFMTYNLLHLPVLDFRPYRVGVNIPQAMSVPQGAPVDEYRYSFAYKKDGVIQEFGLDALPDSTWTFVEQKSEMINKGYEPPIRDFSILDGDFRDIGPEILSYPGKTYLLILYDVNKASIKGVQKINEYFASRYTQNLRFYGVTASSSQEVDAFKKKHWLTFPVYSADPIFLKTIIRANPGMMVIENGIITGKWSWRDIHKIN